MISYEKNDNVNIEETEVKFREAMLTLSRADFNNYQKMATRVFEDETMRRACILADEVTQIGESLKGDD